MATKSGFSKGWKALVDHKWSKQHLGGEATREGGQDSTISVFTRDAKSSCDLFLAPDCVFISRQCSVQISCGTDQSQLRNSLREIAEMPAIGPNSSE